MGIIVDSIELVVGLLDTIVDSFVVIGSLDIEDDLISVVGDVDNIVDSNTVAILLVLSVFISKVFVSNISDLSIFVLDIVGTISDSIFNFSESEEVEIIIELLDNVEGVVNNIVVDGSNIVERSEDFPFNSSNIVVDTS